MLMIVFILSARYMFISFVSFKGKIIQSCTFLGAFDLFRKLELSTFDADSLIYELLLVGVNWNLVST